MTAHAVCYILNMNRIARTSAVALAGASLFTLVTPLMASASATKVSTYIYNCSTRTQRPKEIVLTCADANTYVTSISWSNWSSNVAHAKGIFHWNTCTPNCAAGTTKSKAITFTATDRRRVKGIWLYTELTATKNTWRTGSAIWTLPTSAL
jgi:hypothetical protein